MQYFLLFSFCYDLWVWGCFKTLLFLIFFLTINIIFKVLYWIINSIGFLFDFFLTKWLEYNFWLRSFSLIQIYFILRMISFSNRFLFHFTALNLIAHPLYFLLTFIKISYHFPNIFLFYLWCFPHKFLLYWLCLKFIRIYILRFEIWFILFDLFSFSFIQTIWIFIWCSAIQI